MSVPSTIPTAGPGRTTEGASLSAELRCTLYLGRVTVHVTTLTTVGPAASTSLSSLVAPTTTPGGRVTAATGTILATCVPIPGKCCKQLYVLRN